MHRRCRVCTLRQFRNYPHLRPTRFEPKITGELHSLGAVEFVRRNSDSKTSFGARLSGTASFRKCIMLQIVSTARASSSSIGTSFGSLLLRSWPSANFGPNKLEKYAELLRRIDEETRRRGVLVQLVVGLACCVTCRILTGPISIRHPCNKVLSATTRFLVSTESYSMTQHGHTGKR